MTGGVNLWGIWLHRTFSPKTVSAFQVKQAAYFGEPIV